MAEIKLVENYSVALARQSVRDSLSYHGEECIALAMYHPTIDEGTQPRCPVCFDDIYKQPDQLCTYCYGTTFAGGVKTAARVWSMFSDKTADEVYREHGVWASDARQIQCEAFPILLEHDYLVRVRRWNQDHTPLEIEGYYEIQQVTRDSMRTGNRFGQYTWDIVGQRGNVTQLQKNSIITRFPVIGVQFSDTIHAGSTGFPPVVQPDSMDDQVGYSPLVVQPDVKVIFYPVTITPTQGVFVGDGVSTVFFIAHNFHSKDVVVTVYSVSTGAEVDVDVVHNTNTVRVTFGSPPAVDEYRVVIGQ